MLLAYGMIAVMGAIPAFPHTRCCHSSSETDTLAPDAAKVQLHAAQHAAPHPAYLESPWLTYMR
jgi:hypothetical protein